MATIRPVTELDFDQIKADIITFIKSNPAFSDYNFEGSALNAIADILAFNTHNNAYYANMQHNEGFLDTAQKRSSVVSRSKELGYVPRSVVGSTAYVNIAVAGKNISTVQLTIPRGTAFTSTNDNGSYTFVVADTVTTSVANGVYVFPQVKLVNGIDVQNYFTVNSLSNIRSIFTIPNVNVDISTLRVFVRDSISSVERTEYFVSKNVYELKANSRVFFVQESYDGYFQFYFGNNVIGAQPVDGNVIDIEYIVSDNFNLSDGCRLFNFNGTLGDSVNIETTQVSFGGSDKEQIESIKINATKSNSAKGRYVTISDYELMLKENFNFIKSVSVWGGEDNVPPVYGKVFLSIQPMSGYTISDSVKRDVLTPVIRAGGLLTISPEFVDPSYTNLSFSTKLKFNPNKTMSTQSDVESVIRGIITSYVDSISTFNTDYLESELIAKIMASDSGIVSTAISKHVGFKLTPLIGIESSHIKNINNKIVQGTIKSTKFYCNSSSLVTIKEVPNKYTYNINSSGGYETIADIGLYDDSDALISVIGTANLYTGKFTMSFSVYAYLNDNRFISVMCQLVDADVSTTRNQILIIDKNIVDSSIGLLDNNEVTTEIYGK